MRSVTLTLVMLSLVALAGGAPLEGQHRQNKVITAEEIEREKANINTAYDAVQTLRPRWFELHEVARLPGRADEPLKATPVRVYLNDVNAGDVDYLKTIPAERVLEMRMLSVNETASRYGPTDGQAAIVVTLKR